MRVSIASLHQDASKNVIAYILMEEGVLAWLIILTIFVAVFLAIFCCKWYGTDCTKHDVGQCNLSYHHLRKQAGSIRSLEDRVDGLRPFSRECASLKSKVDGLSVELGQVSASFKLQEDVVADWGAKCVSLKNDVSDLTKELERFSADMRDLTNTIASNNYEMMVIHPSVGDCI